MLKFVMSGTAVTKELLVILNLCTLECHIWCSP